MVKFSALIAAVLAFSADSYRTDVKSHQEVGNNLTTAWNFDGLTLGPDPGGPLIPSMVPPPGTTFEVHNRERLDFFESNEYRWAFLSITQNGNQIPIDEWFASLSGSFFGNIFGARRTVVNNNLGVPIFVIELSKYTWNPTRLHWSFRIRHPETEAILYTINKDWFGAGFLFIRDEWRIYRGRQRDRDQIYHIIGGYLGYGHRFYHDKSEWRRELEPVAEATQSIARDVLGAPSVFSLKVHEGEDTALLLATTVIIDMVHESEAAARARDRARNRRNRRSSSFIEGAEESVWSEEAMAQAESEDSDTKWGERRGGRRGR